MNERVTPQAKYTLTPIDLARVQALKGDMTAEKAQYISGPAVRYRNRTYLRYLLLGLIARGRVKMAEQVLLKLKMTAKEKREWLNETELEGSILRPGQGDYATFLLAAVMMPAFYGVSAKVDAIRLLLVHGSVNVNGRMDMPDHQGMTAFMALCDRRYADGIPLEMHKELVKKFLYWRGEPFRRIGTEGRGACPYERAARYFPELLEVMPNVPKDADGFTDKNKVDYGEPLPYEAQNLPMKNDPAYPPVFHWRPSQKP